MRGVSVDVHVGDGLLLPIGPDVVERALRAVLASEGVAAAALSVALVSDDEIAGLNHEYLGHEGPTDVISFPLSAPGGAPVGDVYIGAEQARRQAEELGVDLAEELVRLAVHGALHVLGYEHPEGADRDASPMYRRQEELVSRILASGAERGA
jgi:probable rRNA maturation factor